MDRVAEGLTAKKKRAYLRSGSNCPFCGSTSISGESVDIEGRGASQELSCAGCERR